MTFAGIEVEIAALLARLADQPHDRQELELQLREKLGQLKVFGLPLPDDLVALEATLDRQLCDEARQRSRQPEEPPRS